MSNFTYEIDERNLRLRMKDFTIPVKEDAWQKFETFADISASPRRETGIKFNFSLNRSVILPSIFGVVIILFSFLLVNFVSIKSPAASLKEQKAGISTAASPAPQNEPKEKPAPAVIQQEAKPVVEEPKPAVVEDIKPEEKAMINALVAEPSPEASQKLNNEQPGSDSVASAASEDEERAKRRAARRAARAEAKKLEEIKPTPVYEEHDVEEVRPN